MIMLWCSWIFFFSFCFIDFSTKIGDTINLQNEHQNSYLQKLTLQIYEQHTKKVIYIYIYANHWINQIKSRHLPMSQPFIGLLKFPYNCVVQTPCKTINHGCHCSATPAQRPPWFFSNIEALVFFSVGSVSRERETKKHHSYSFRWFKNGQTFNSHLQQINATNKIWHENITWYRNHDCKQTFPIGFIGAASILNMHRNQS